MQEPLRSYVQRDGTVPAVCPHCGKTNPISANNIHSGKGAIDAQCPCGNRYSVFAEFRKAYRRETNLPGFYVKPLPKKDRGDILIKNMSMTGVGFLSMGEMSISEGDEVILNFVLVDKDQTVMETKAIVVYVKDSFAGCTFTELSPQQEDTLASFLMHIR
jgi:hypothetical protein